MNGEEGITDLVRGCILPLQEKHAELFKKEGGVFKKDLDVLKNPQGLFATYSASCLFVKCVRTHRATHTLSLIHISEPTRPISISYAVFCLKKKRK